MITPYVYKWTNLLTNKWYIGSRTSKKCNINDGYICSSRVVKPLILQNRNEWKKDIIATGSVDEMIELETFLLQETDAKNNPMSFNQHNGDGKFKFKGGLPLPEEHKIKLGLSKKGRIAWNKGKKMSREYCEKHAAGHKGKKRPSQKPESNLLRSLSLRGRTPWNKGISKNNRG
jgi:hypothetical protein